MRRYAVLSLLTCLLSFPSFSQNNLAEILRSSNNFEEIVEMGEQYFQRKHPNLQLRDLAQGVYRDGEFVKFMRWRSFWQHSLNPDGTLGDISAFEQNKQLSKSNQEESLSPYKDVTWTNLSYSNYIVSQIGLGRTTSIGFHPNNPDIFYVGAAIGGIWRTTDGGQTYTPLGDELPFMAVSSIIVNKNSPFEIFIAVSDHVWYGPPSIGVYRSINGGASWHKTALSFDLADDIRIYWMEADPNNPNKMFVATSDGLYRTTNGFVTVSKVSNASCFDVKINPGNSNIVYAGGNNGEFFRSADGGSTFALVQDFGNGQVYTATTPLNPAKVYARNGTTVYKSTDSGVSFPSNFSLPTTTGLLVFSPANENTLLTGFIGVNYVTQRSDDDGATFYNTSHWLGNNGLPLIHVDQRNMFTNPLEPDYVYFCNDGGVYRYVISTNSFENLSENLLITQFYDIAVSQTDENVIGGGSQDNGNVFRESDGTWDDYAPTGDGMNQEIDPTDANTRYWAYQYGSLHRWVNGVNKNIAPPGQSGQGAWETPYRLDPNNSSRIIAGYDRVYESTNKGDNWTDISGAIFGGDLEEIAIAKSNPNRIYAARGTNLYVKNTADNTWTTRSMPGSISDLEVDPVDMNIAYITVPGFTAGSKVYRSVDAGANWTNISGSLPNVSTGAIEIYENIPGALFVGTDAGVYYRDNTLADWQEYGEVPHTRVEDIEIQYSANLIRIGTHGRGVLEAPIIINPCDFGDPDADNDGVCDANDPCPDFDNSLIGTPCDDGDPLTTGETYSGNCACEGGISNITYCAAAGAAGTGADWISRVALNTLDNSSGKSGYSDFRAQSTTLGLGSTYTLKVDLNSSFPLDKVYAWIDYDRDGLFEETELIDMSDIDGNHKSQGTVTVPTDIGTEATTMRVRVIYADPNNPDPCGDYFGEVEDYTIDFSYCTAQGRFGTGDDFINNVKVNTIDNNSVQTVYSDFTDLSTDMVRGGSYPIEVSLHYAFSIDDVYVWVDFDQDGLFEESEQVAMSKPAVGSNSKSTGTIDVPTDALPGKTRMRVRSQYDNTVDPQPCGSAYFGEVEDYTINVTYCAAAGRPGTGDDYINRVTLNTIDNTSGKTDYSDFKNISTDLIRGASYPITVRLWYAFEVDRVYVWIDYNKNGEFEPSERTDMSDPPTQYNAGSTGTLNIPADAVMGETVMRVRTIYSTTAIDPCGSALFGEVEDYTVNLTYCAASGSINSDHITRVQFNTIDNASGSGGYSDFTNIQTTLSQGSSYELSVNINYTFFNDKAFAWIDYDQNGAFTTDERVMNVTFSESFNSLALRNVNIPSDAKLGATKLRIRFNYNESPDPCGVQSGEVEDYTVIIDEPCADTDNDGICDDVDQCVGYSDPPLVLTDDPVADGEYLAVTSIESSVTINSGLQIHYEAGNSITLKPGFHAKAGSTFSAIIGDCTNMFLLDEVANETLIRTEEEEAEVLEKTAQPDVQVFPNPFTSSTNIAYHLPEGTPLQIFVADIRGKRVGTLLNTNWQDSGSYQFEWQSPAGFSGILLLYFRTGDEVIVRKMMIVK